MVQVKINRGWNDKFTRDGHLHVVLHGSFISMLQPYGKLSVNIISSISLPLAQISGQQQKILTRHVIKVYHSSLHSQSSHVFSFKQSLGSEWLFDLTITLLWMEDVCEGSGRPCQFRLLFGVIHFVLRENIVDLPKLLPMDKESAGF